MKPDTVKQIRNSCLMIRDLRHCKFYGNYFNYWLEAAKTDKDGVIVILICQ